ncbi:MAG TPA: hypothetical protein VHE37_03140 [Nevskiaceae bacterium]|nr:hypothetical protein [Nevskiaceae bacterium]
MFRQARLWFGMITLLTGMSSYAQIETTPLDQAPVNAPRSVVVPPVLPPHPVRPAIQAIANGGSGGLSYSGPSGAMNTSPDGASCAVTCSLAPREQYSIDCPAGNTAYCQCDELPYAACRPQQ